MKIPKKLLSRIKKHAVYSFYRMNAKTASSYSFSLIYNEKGEAVDWEGGWTWQKKFDGEYFRIDLEDMEKIHINPDMWEGNEDV